METRPSLTLPVQQANVSLQPTEAERVEHFQLPIQEIQVGMRVPAHNPLISDDQRAEFDSSIDPTSWRKFTLDVEKADGTGNVRVTVLRPSSWLVEEVEATAMALVELGLEEAEQEWSQLQDWEKVLVRLDLSISTAVRRCMSGDPTIWDTQVVPLMNSVVSDTNCSMGEASLEIELDEEYLAEVAEVQAGAGVDSTVFLDLPELGAIGFATVLTNDPLGPNDRPLNYVDGEYLDPSCWKKMTLLSPRADGSETTVALLRSPRWIRDSIQLASGESITKIDGHLIGKSIEIVVPEIALAGPARILSIEDCPSILDGPGEIVTGTFHTNRAKVLDLQFSNQSDVIGVTAEHPFWSETRQQFVPAGELEIGEEALALNGQRTYLSSISPRDEPESVYNFEVANQHVYYVSGEGLLVHNAVYIMKGRKKYTGSSYTEALYNSGRTLTVKQAEKLGSAIHGHHIVMKGAFSRSPAMRMAVEESRRILNRAGIRGRHNLGDIVNCCVLRISD